LLTTSGVDGVYPPGLPVARIEKIERRVDTVFARIYCVPLAQVAGTGHVMVIDPITAQMLARPAVDSTGKTGQRGAVK
jgi:rod shape-determining protein MreC